MPVSSTPRRPTGPARGILRALAPDGATSHARVAPRAELAPFVEHVWSVEWSLRSPYLAETLPHPCVHVVFEESASDAGRTSRVDVTGVPTTRFSRRLAGTGRVVGVKFRPAVFQPIFGRSMALLRDRVVPAVDVLGPAARDLADALSAAKALDETADAVEAILAPLLPALPRDVVSTRDLVERMATDRELLRSEDVALVAGVDERTLQRRFRRYVGVTPKWVIRRYRLHEAAERLKDPAPPSLAALAAELGYFDQAHFARDFKRVVGRTPRAFAAAEARP